MIKHNFSFSADGSHGVLQLRNASASALDQLRLHFSLLEFRTDADIVGGVLRQQLGDYHEVDLPALAAGADLVLRINFSQAQIRAISHAPAGIFLTRSGVVLPSEPEPAVAIAPNTKLLDSFPKELIWQRRDPALAYRGFMLDLSRHYFEIATIQRLIKLIAYLGFNYLHLHLSDDEGWRLEIEAYPKLTSIGAWRGHGLALPPACGSGQQRYGGYYSQADIRKLVAFADAYGVSIIPELNLPAHARAAVVALHPELSEASDSSRYRSVQGYADNCLNPLLPKTWEFIETVYAQVAELFPAPYIHVGGDEIPDGVWVNSPAAAGHDRSQILHYFYQRLTTLMHRLGKRPIAWQEAAPYLNSKARICHWQPRTPAPAAGSILCQAPYFYLDSACNRDAIGTRWAGFCCLADIMCLPPINSNIYTGVQANLWSEHIVDEGTLHKQLLPRLVAIAHYAWHGNFDDASASSIKAIADSL